MFKKFILMMLATMLAACVQTGWPPEKRPLNWAQPAVAKGLPNLFQVTPNLFRSAQPDVEGLVVLNNKQQLTLDHSMPIKTLLSLRTSVSDEKIYRSRNVHYENIEMDTWDIKEKDVVQALRIINTPSMQPVLVHCKHGADRTGLIMAIYRVVYQGWSKQDAINEMTFGGFGFHPMWKNLINYVNALDVEDIRKKVKDAGHYPEPVFKS